MALDELFNSFDWSDIVFVPLRVGDGLHVYERLVWWADLFG